MYIKKQGGVKKKDTFSSQSMLIIQPFLKKVAKKLNNLTNYDFLVKSRVFDVFKEKA